MFGPKIGPGATVAGVRNVRREGEQTVARGEEVAKALAGPIEV